VADPDGGYASLSYIFGICQSRMFLSYDYGLGTGLRVTLVVGNKPLTEGNQPMSTTSYAWDEGPPFDVTPLIRQVNGSNPAAADLYLRTRHQADIAGRSVQDAGQAAVMADSAKVAHQIVQAEEPQRRAPRPRQRGYAILTVAVDGVACYFAAEALGASQYSTLVWTALFLAVLAVGEIGLDFYRDRHQGAWHAVAYMLGAFVAGLGVLRFWFLATVGASGLIPAALGALLFTAVTAGFLLVGYRALRMAETPSAFRARRAAETAAQAALSAHMAARTNIRERDRLFDAYLGQVRRHALELYTAEQQAVEKAVRRHLLGEETP